MVFQVFGFPGRTRENESLVELRVLIFGYALSCTTLRVVTPTTRSIVRLNSYDAERRATKFANPRFLGWTMHSPAVRLKEDIETAAILTEAACSEYVVYFRRIGAVRIRQLI